MDAIIVTDENFVEHRQNVIRAMANDVLAGRIRQFAVDGTVCVWDSRQPYEITEGMHRALLAEAQAEALRRQLAPSNDSHRSGA